MEELDIAGMLETLAGYDLSPIERVLAAHTGTVQLLLSLWWNEPVIVQVIGSQTESDGILSREASLKLLHRGTEVAKAVSFIDLSSNAPDIIADIRAGRRGIGQIALAHGINTRRDILEVTIEDDNLHRRYRIHGAGVNFDIHEYFPRQLYRQQG